MNRSAYISYEASNAFSKLVVDYQNQDDKLRNFISDFPSIESIQKQIVARKKKTVDRKALLAVLAKQYQENGINLTDTRAEEYMLSLASENTFTITTAHQPNIFTGFMYTIYKIVHVIHLAKSCREEMPEYNFVPIFFIGSEDNDIEEIGTFNFKGKKYQWKPDQSGACGRFSTESLVKIRDEIIAQFGSSETELKLKEQILAAYDGKKTLTQATQYFIHTLFSTEGLIILDADERSLKQNFKHIIKDELLNQTSNKLVIEHNKRLSKEYKIQVEPRKLNLFYLKEEVRERIEAKNGHWSVLKLDYSFKDITLVDTNPELFSPNVVLRPLYQEAILPNVAFVGGGSEIAYWSELKTLFDYYEIPFPILYVRNSVSVVSEKIFAKMEQLGFEESFKPLEKALKEKAVEHGDYIQLLDDLKKIEKQYDKALEGSKAISPNLEVSVAAQLAKIQRLHERLKTKYRSHIKRQMSDLENLKLEIKHELYPDNTLQERTENYLELVCRYKIDLISIFLEMQAKQNQQYLILSV